MTIADLGPKVSVIVPFLNPGDFLREAIESVLAQTFQEWELILVDDGSTDQSTAIAKSYASSSGQITYLEHHGHVNKGMPASRNLGINNSCGRYVAQLDSDDLWQKNFLEEFVSILDHYPSVAMTFGPMKVWFSWSRAQGVSSDRIQSFSFRPDKIISPPSFVPLLLTGRNDPQGSVIRRSVLEEVGLYEESLEMCEDWALFVKIALKHDIFPLSKCHYWYRQHQAQFCSQRHHSGRFHREFLPFIAWLKSYLASVGCDDPDVLSAVSRLIWRNRFRRAGESVWRTLNKFGL